MVKKEAMVRHIFLLADIEDSKQLKVEKRNILQEKLQRTLDELNNLDQGIVSQYSITVGDEFQTVLKNADHLFTDIWHLLSDLHPVMLRFSIGVRAIATSIQKENVLTIDGPTFYTARDGINDLKNGEGLFRVSINSQNTPELNIINNSLDLISKQVRTWNANRIRLQYLLRKGMDYKTIAKEIGISERSFYKNKKAGSLDLVNALFDDVQQYLNNQLTE